MWKHSSSFVRLHPEIGESVSKGHRQRIEDGAARVRSEAPSWTLESRAIRLVIMSVQGLKPRETDVRKAGSMLLIQFIRATTASTCTQRNAELPGRSNMLIVQGRQPQAWRDVQILALGCLSMASATRRRWILPVAVLGMISVKNVC